MKSAALLVLATLFTRCASSQQVFADPANLAGERISPKTGRELPIDQGATGLAEQLRRLQTRASLMLIVAHPDDEDGGMLTLYSRGQGARVATLTLTRGEGGQNAMTGDFEDALGLIRTQELLAADRYFGADQFFGTEVDFGFSKTKEEAFRKWTHERVLYDAVRAVRLYRPLVIAAVFVGGVTDGHGQHQVSGEIAQEVFKAAADPKTFPELTREGILPWAPLKVYARVPSFAITGKGLFDYATNQFITPRFTNYVAGTTSATPPTADVVIHEGQVDDLLTSAGANAADLAPSARNSTEKLSYVQFARLGLGLQKTQIGPGARVPSAGAYDVGYHRYGSRLAHQPAEETSFFEGVDTSVRGIASLSSAPPASLTAGVQALSEAIAATSRMFRPQDPAASAPALVAAQHHLGALLYELEKTSFPGKFDVLHELRVKQVQLNEAIVLALGIQLEAVAETPQADLPQGQPVAVGLTLSTHADQAIGIFSESLRGTHGGDAEVLLAKEQEPSLHPAQAFVQRLHASTNMTAQATRPYFQRESIEEPVYRLLDPALRNAPETPVPLTGWATLRFHETEVQVGRAVEVGKQTVAVIPAASVSLAIHAQLVPNTEHQIQLQVAVRPPDNAVLVEVPKNWPAPSPSAQQPDGGGAVELTVKLPAGQRQVAKLEAVTPLGDGAQVHDGYRPVGYSGLPRTNMYSPATLNVVPAQLALPQHRRIAYLPGTGDAVADGLASVGLPTTRITVADLTEERLRSFDTVILGVRTYNAHPDLHGQPTATLLAFARRGGNVIVQYQTAEFSAADAPYPLALGSAEKVVDETAPVHLVQAASEIFKGPNLITPADFHGWVEERGHGFLESWDSRYVALTETHDPGAPAEGVAPQMPQRGGLITAPVGQGHWTYCAFALYRQLPEAVPGAFRIFMNLIALADLGSKP